jgi:hypothetical protein
VDVAARRVWQRRVSHVVGFARFVAFSSAEYFKNTSTKKLTLLAHLALTALINCVSSRAD